MRKIIILFLTLGLQGCLAGAFVAGGAATGGLVTDPRSLNTMKVDEVINFKVNKKIAHDKALSSQASISAISYGQVVLLTGTACDRELSKKAEAYARQTPQVKRVFNQIEVVHCTSVPSDSIYARTKRAAKDIGITSAIKTKMFSNRHLKSNHFKIVTENGVVFILGIATPSQADLAVSIAKNTLGVKKVVRLIEVSRPE